MSPVAILGQPAPLIEYYVGGPWLNNAALPLVFSNYLISNLNPLIPEVRGTSAPRPIWEHSQGGSGIVQVGVRYRGIQCMSCSTTIIAFIEEMGGISMMPVHDITNLDPAFSMPSWRRVMRLKVNLAMDAGTLDRNTGLIFGAHGGPMSTPQWPIAPATVFGGGQGVVGDGAGNWNWESFGPSPNPATVLESVSLSTVITDASDWHTFEWVFISGAGGREAALQLSIDGALVIERDWVTAPVLQPLAANQNRWVPIWQVGTTSGDNMYFGDWEFAMGRFLPDGRELFK